MSLTGMDWPLFLYIFGFPFWSIVITTPILLISVWMIPDAEKDRLNKQRESEDKCLAIMRRYEEAIKGGALSKPTHDGSRLEKPV